MPKVLIGYINEMEKAKTLEEFNENDARYNKRYNMLLNSDDFDSGAMDMKYMDALRQRSFLVRKARRENKQD